MTFGKLYSYEVTICSLQYDTTSVYRSVLTHVLQRNPRSTAILAVAKANGLDLEVVPTDTEKKTPEYLKINALGKVPTFVGADGYNLSECIAIAVYGMWKDSIFLRGKFPLLLPCLLL